MLQFSVLAFPDWIAPGLAERVHDGGMPLLLLDDVEVDVVLELLLELLLELVLLPEGYIAIDRFFETSLDRPSVTLTVKANVPGLVGIPEITPPEERDRPGGRLLPPARAHE